MYSGKARWEHIARLKESCAIPVLGNGDIFEAPDALEMMHATGCDGVVIGRGCLGNPWLFRNLRRVFDADGVPTRPTLDELVGVIRRHFALLEEHNADYPRLAAFQMRKFGTWYVKGITGSSKIRTAFQSIAGRADLEVVIERILAAEYQAGMRDPNLPTRLAGE